MFGFIGDGFVGAGWVLDYGQVEIINLVSDFGRYLTEDSNMTKLIVLDSLMSNKTISLESPIYE